MVQELMVAEKGFNTEYCLKSPVIAATVHYVTAWCSIQCRGLDLHTATIL